MIRLWSFMLLIFGNLWASELDLSLKHPPKPVDFGEAVMGEEIKVKLILSNSGNTSLLIDRIKPSCGCTAAIINDRQLELGSKAELTLALDTSQKVGRLSKSVRIYLAGNDIPRIVLIQGLVTPAKKSHGMKAKSIFDPECALCHTHYGKGRKGRGLSYKVFDKFVEKGGLK